MAADAREAVRRLPGVRDVSVRLEDHYTGEEINAALAGGEGFTGAFPGETDDDDLEALRELFQRKALIARQSTVCEALLAGGRQRRGGGGAARAAICPTTPEARRVPGAPRAALGLAADAGLAGVRAARAASRWRPTS